MSTNISTYNLY